MTKRKFKIGDKVIIYGTVRATVLGLGTFNDYLVEYEKKIGMSNNQGQFPALAMELVEIFESPLYQVMREDNDE